MHQSVTDALVIILYACFPCILQYMIFKDRFAVLTKLLIFCAFVLKVPIHYPFWRVLGMSFCASDSFYDIDADSRKDVPFGVSTILHLI